MITTIAAWREFWDAHVEPVAGWLNWWEGHHLYDLALESGHGRLAEIGSYCGRSTLCIARALRDRGHGTLHSVDLFDRAYTFEGSDAPMATAEILDANLRRAGLRELVVITPGDSRDGRTVTAVPGDLGFLFVDGDHDYGALAVEWKLWRPKMAPRASVAYHDYGNAVVGDGPTRFCGEIASQFERVSICDRFLREPGAIPGGLFIGRGLLP